MFNKIKAILNFTPTAIVNRTLGFLTKKTYELYTELKKAKTKFKNLSQTNYQLGVFHLKKNNMYDAKLRFKLAIFFNKKNAEAYYKLGYCYGLEKKLDLATKKIKMALKSRPNFPEAVYMLAVYADGETTKTIPLSIIEDYFDDLGKLDRLDNPILNYNNALTHTHFVNVVLENVNPAQITDLLDLGCGDGELGKVLKNKLNIRSLIGVDISAGMLTLAKAQKLLNRPVYDLLHKEDYAIYLAKEHPKANLIIASLSFQYNELLTNNLLLSAYNLISDGIIIFSVAECQDHDIALAKSKKHLCYSKEYVTKQVIAADLRVSLVHSVTIDDDNAILIYVCIK